MDVGAERNRVPEVTRRRPQVIAAVAVVAVVAAVTTVALAMRASDGPPVITLAGGAAGDAAEQRTATLEAVPDLAYTDRIWAPTAYRFELADGARVDAGEATAWQLTPPEDLVGAVTALADRFGVGDVRELADLPGSYVAGPDDGSGPTLWVGVEGEWYYSDPGNGAVWDCAEPFLVEPDDGLDVADAPRPEIAMCETPEPPSGVPSETEARTLADALFDDLDLPGEVAIREVHADEWGAWVEARSTVEGLPTDLWVSAGWGADAQLTSVSGSLAEPTRVHDYPTIDAEQAVERLERGGLGGGIGTPRPLPLPSDTLRSDTLPSDTVAPDSPVTDQEPATAPLEQPDERDLGDPDVAERDLAEPQPAEPQPEPGVGDQDLAEPLPVDPWPEPEGEVELEVITVTLTEVEPVLLRRWDTDGVVWLLPGYRFTDTDAGTWEVLAVADDHLASDDGASDGAGSAPALPDDGSGGSGGVEPGSPGGGSQPEPGEVPPSAPDADDDAGAPGAGAEGEDPVPPDLGIDPEIEALAAEVLGLAEAEAVSRIEQAGAEPRIVARDDEDLPVTFDLRTDRINLDIQDGVVAATSVG